MFFWYKWKKKKSSISNISKIGLSPFILISKELLFICGENKISIININEYELIRKIEVSNSGWINGACMLNENIILTGDSNSNIKEWKIEGDNLILISTKENAHNNYIYTILKIGDNHILTGDGSGEEKIW